MRAPQDNTVAIGKPERQLHKASHCGSKQQYSSPDETTLLLLVRATYMVLFFARIPFVVNRAFQRNANGVVATTQDHKPLCLRIRTGHRTSTSSEFSQLLRLAAVAVCLAKVVEAIVRCVKTAVYFFAQVHRSKLTFVVSWVTRFAVLNKCIFMLQLSAKDLREIDFHTVTCHGVVVLLFSQLLFHVMAVSYHTKCRWDIQNIYWVGLPHWYGTCFLAKHVNQNQTKSWWKFSAKGHCATVRHYAPGIFARWMDAQTSTTLKLRPRTVFVVWQADTRSPDLREKHSNVIRYWFEGVDRCKRSMEIAWSLFIRTKLKLWKFQATLARLGSHSLLVVSESKLVCLLACFLYANQWMPSGNHTIKIHLF